MSYTEVKEVAGKTLSLWRFTPQDPQFQAKLDRIHGQPIRIPWSPGGDGGISSYR